MRVKNSDLVLYGKVSLVSAVGGFLGYKMSTKFTDSTACKIISSASAAIFSGTVFFTAVMISEFNNNLQNITTIAEIILGSDY